MVERIIMVATDDTVYVYQESQADNAAIVYHVMIGANLDAELRTIPRSRWDQVHATLATDPDIHIVDMRPGNDTPPHTTRRTPPTGDQNTGATGGRDRDEPPDLSGFDTATHHAVQKACRHVIHCAVDAATRGAVIANLHHARRVGDMAAVPVLLAQLTGPYTRIPAAPTTPAAGQQGSAADPPAGTLDQ